MLSIESWLTCVEVVAVLEACACAVIACASVCHLSVGQSTADSDCDDCSVLVCATDFVVTNLLIMSNTEY